MEIPSDCPPVLANLMLLCWKTNAAERPEFIDIVNMLTKKEKKQYETIPSQINQINYHLSPSTNSVTEPSYDNAQPIAYDNTL